VHFLAGASLMTTMDANEQHRLAVSDRRLVYHCDTDGENYWRKEGRRAGLLSRRAAVSERRIPEGLLPGLMAVGMIHGLRSELIRFCADDGRYVGIHYLECGHLACVVDGKETNLVAGDAVLTMPGQRPTFSAIRGKAFRFHWVKFDLGIRAASDRWDYPAWMSLSAAEQDEFSDFMTRGSNRVHRIAELGSCFRRIALVVGRWAEPGDTGLLSATVLSVVGVLLVAFREGERLAGQSPSGSLAVERFWEALSANPSLLSQEWTRSRMAQECELHETQFTRLTRTLFGLTPNDYLTRRRLEHAAHLLLGDAGKYITQIALETGFSSNQYFSSLFRRYFGLAPRLYRELHHSREGVGEESEAVASGNADGTLSCNGEASTSASEKGPSQNE
jgi:AraC-like DNA-binding protein